MAISINLLYFGSSLKLDLFRYPFVEYPFLRVIWFSLPLPLTFKNQIFCSFGNVHAELYSLTTIGDDIDEP